MTCRRPTYRTVPHTADAAFEVVSRDRATLFADSVLAFEDLMVGLDAVEAREECLLDVDGVDDGDLLVALLSRALYLFEVQGTGVLRGGCHGDYGGSRGGAGARGGCSIPDATPSSSRSRP